MTQNELTSLSEQCIFMYILALPLEITRGTLRSLALLLVNSNFAYVL